MKVRKNRGRQNKEREMGNKVAGRASDRLKKKQKESKLLLSATTSGTCDVNGRESVAVNGSMTHYPELGRITQT